MSNYIPVVKDPDAQTAVPTAWRDVLADIANAVGRNDYRLLANVSAVRPIPVALIRAIEKNIRDYGVSLTDLPEEAWRTSACQWMGSYWDVLVDLFSIEEGASDLALSVRVHEVGADYSFEVLSVYVP